MYQRHSATESPRRLDIPRPKFPMKLKREITFEELQQEISPIVNEKLSAFAEFVREQSKDAVRAKRLDISDPEYEQSYYTILKHTVDDISRMEKRDIEISHQLQRIRALEFALETEQNSIRHQLYK